MKNLTTETAKEWEKNATLVFKGRKLRIFGYEAPNTTTQELNKKEEEEIWE